MNNKTTARKGGVPKGYKKKPIKQDCPFCDYVSYHPPGMARHIQTVHPDKWKGNLGESLGGKPSRSWKEDKPTNRLTVSKIKQANDPVEAARLQKRRDYQAKLRTRYLRQGLTTTGKKRKHPLRTSTLERYPFLRKNDVHPEPEKPTGPVRGHIDHCPACGENIKPYEEAKGLHDYMVATGKLKK